MRVVGSVEINRPASQVWAYLADYGNDPSWRAASPRCAHGWWGLQASQDDGDQPLDRGLGG